MEIKSNMEYASFLIREHFTIQKRKKLLNELLKLDSIMFKSYLKELPLHEIIEATMLSLEKRESLNKENND